MILIVSDNDDNSTNDVIDWLIDKHAKFVRINRTDVLNVKYITIQNGIYEFEFEMESLNEQIKIKFSDLTSYWYRRGYLNIQHKGALQISFSVNEDIPLLNAINRYLTDEGDVIRNCVQSLLHQLNGFGKDEENKTNKLINLMVAESVGFSIPVSIVTQDKVMISSFIKAESNETITKSINQTGGIFWNDSFTHGLTSLVTSEDIENANCNWPSFLQKKVEKKYELRIFYLDKKIFASSIFSQNNPKTIVDFRNYDNKKRNRVVPYLLPFDIEQKLIAFMEKISMKSGSIDMIVNGDNDYVFLEVNPIGQFAQVSIPCNYYIEEYIANYLINGN